MGGRRRRRLRRGGRAAPAAGVDLLAIPPRRGDLSPQPPRRPERRDAGPPAVRPLPAAPPDRPPLRLPLRAAPRPGCRRLPRPPRGQAALGGAGPFDAGIPDPARRRPPIAPSKGSEAPLGARAVDARTITSRRCRWPTGRSRWPGGIATSAGSAAYSPVLARWVTLADYFHLTDRPYETFRVPPDEYISPYLAQADRPPRPRPDLAPRPSCPPPRPIRRPGRPPVAPAGDHRRRPAEADDTEELEQR